MWLRPPLATMARGARPSKRPPSKRPPPSSSLPFPLPGFSSKSQACVDALGRSWDVLRRCAASWEAEANAPSWDGAFGPSLLRDVESVERDVVVDRGEVEEAAKKVEEAIEKEKAKVSTNGPSCEENPSQ